MYYNNIWWNNLSRATSLKSTFSIFSLLSQPLTSTPVTFTHFLIIIFKWWNTILNVALKSFAEANQRSLSVNMTWLGIEPKTSGVEITKGSPWAYTDHKCYAGLTKGRGFNSPSDNNSIIRRLSRRVLGELQLVDSTFQSKDRRQVQTLQTDWNA